jgi:hypothetical protein
MVRTFPWQPRSCHVAVSTNAGSGLIQSLHSSTAVASRRAHEQASGCAYRSYICWSGNSPWPVDLRASCAPEPSAYLCMAWWLLTNLDSIAVIIHSFLPNDNDCHWIPVNTRPSHDVTNLFWRMASSGMLRRVALVRTDVSEELSASIIRVTRIGKLGTSLAVTSSRRTLQRNTMLFLVSRFLSPCWWRRYVHPKRRFLQEPHGLTSQKTTFFIVTALKTSNLT